METKKIDTHKILTIVGIVLCVILVPILIINCTLIVKSFINKDEVPNFGGVMPLIVLTDSMYPDIKSGDMIFCRTVEADDVKKGDVISFFDPAGDGNAVVTHKVIEIIERDGERYFRTKGINNNTADDMLVSEDDLVGRYTGVRLAGAGNVALFMQTVPGLIVCVFVPLLLLIGYDLIRRRVYEKNKVDDVAALKAELEALKAANAAKTVKAGSEREDAPVEVPAAPETVIVTVPEEIPETADAPEEEEETATDAEDPQN
ncbi:MAG: signal peptidase I [Clostridia bacterium]|nr:signal peptidase I [Clostridia bacterium]